jgi:ribosome recycling factor
VKTKVHWYTSDKKIVPVYKPVTLTIYHPVLKESSMTIADIKKNTDLKMHKSIETLKADLAKVRTGRAHTGILDHVMVDYYGTPTQITQVANVTLIDARTIGVQPWEKKMLANIEKAIRDADLGLNPSTQGELIRVPTPALTEERRKEMVKLVKSEAEDAKIAIRNIRRDANEGLKKLLKDKAISEDDERRTQDEVQKMTDKFVSEIDKLVVDKEKEVLTV